MHKCVGDSKLTIVTHWGVESTPCFLSECVPEEVGSHREPIRSCRKAAGSAPTGNPLLSVFGLGGVAILGGVSVVRGVVKVMGVAEATGVAVVSGVVIVGGGVASKAE